MLTTLKTKEESQPEQSVETKDVFNMLQQSQLMSIGLRRLIQLERRTHSDGMFPKTAQVANNLFVQNQAEIKAMSERLFLDLSLSPELSESKVVQTVPEASIDLHLKEKTPQERIGFGPPTIGGLIRGLIPLGSLEKSGNSEYLFYNDDLHLKTDTSFIGTGLKRPLVSKTLLPGKKSLTFFQDVSPIKKESRLCTHVDAETGRICTTKAIGISGVCKKHGGGKRCSFEGCKKASQGKTGLCVAHGGGKRCCEVGCERLARGKSSFCIPHGGGVRCVSTNCKKLAQGGTHFCIKHGGGKRCSHEELEGDVMKKCTKSAVSNTGLCVAHGGGKRCCIEKCERSAVGGTSFCVRHGGGKRCNVDQCNRSAVGKRGFCIGHGRQR